MLTDATIIVHDTKPKSFQSEQYKSHGTYWDATLQHQVDLYQWSQFGYTGSGAQCRWYLNNACHDCDAEFGIKLFSGNRMEGRPNENGMLEAVSSHALQERLAEHGLAPHVGRLVKVIRTIPATPLIAAHYHVYWGYQSAVADIECTVEGDDDVQYMYQEYINQRVSAREEVDRLCRELEEIGVSPDAQDLLCQQDMEEGEDKDFEEWCEDNGYSVEMDTLCCAIDAVDMTGIADPRGGVFDYDIRASNDLHCNNVGYCHGELVMIDCGRHAFGV